MVNWSQMLILNEIFIVILSVIFYSRSKLIDYYYLILNLIEVYKNLIFCFLHISPI